MLNERIIFTRGISCLRKMFKNKVVGWLMALTLAFFMIIGPSFVTIGSPGPLVYTVTVEGTVTAGTANYIERGLELAERDNAKAVVILLNTPGGLVSATLDIIQDMSASKIPVITYVSPEGGIAASAGTFILLNGHVAAMSPGTTCGAAMPVTMSVSGDTPQAADQKTINFLAGHMESIAQERGRPTDIARKFVLENLSLNYSEAQKAGVVDLVASDINELLDKIDGQEVAVKGGVVALATSGAEVKEIPMDTSERFINLISNPTLAMILLLLGIYGLIIGFYSPGFFLPEVLGAICLILGLYGIGLFQRNLTAAMLIVLGIGLLVAEVLTPTYGILGVGGLVSVILGILFFPVEPLMPVGWFAAFKALALGVGVVGALFVGIVIAGLLRIRRSRPVHGDDEFSESRAYVVEDVDPEGLIRVQGEIWRANSQDGEVITRGQRVSIVGREGMLLIVKPFKKRDSKE